jgi:PLP dependent protein
MLCEQIRSINNRISHLCEKAGRDPIEVRLIAVSKTFSPSVIAQAYECGLRDFGENYLEELEVKQEELKSLSQIRWIFIGQLQSNKIQKIVRIADEIQSIATEKHARYVERYATAFGKDHYPVWISVNAGAETTKQGCPLSGLSKLAEFITKSCPHLSLQGVMAIPPAHYNDSLLQETNAPQIPELYKDLRQEASQAGLGKLSLGMSGDLALAIFAGTDCVRIGSLIFGERD